VSVLVERVDDPGGHAVVDRLDPAIDEGALSGLLERAGREVDAGLLPACQLAVAHRGRLLATRTCGAPPTSRFLFYSCTKAVTAGAVWRLLGDGVLATDTRVEEVVPRFAEGGKGGVTIEHLLTHTAGFPSAQMPAEDWVDHDRRLARLAAWPLEWEPGSRFEYHPTSAHWVLAEVMEAVTGLDFRDVVRSSVLDPLGLDTLRLGLVPDEQDDVLDVMGVGEEPSEEELGELGGAVGLDVSAIGTSEKDLLRLNDPAQRALGQPGGGAVGRAADLAMYYQALMSDPADLWAPDVLAAGTAEVRCALVDPMTGAPANRTLGLLLAGDPATAMLRGFATTNSSATFGHMGAGGQVAWADPATGLSFAYLTNGLDRNPLRMGARGLSLSYRAGGVVPGTSGPASARLLG
jgi:CubicO group peptidase (beta-lactamase class C family)